MTQIEAGLDHVDGSSNVASTATPGLSKDIRAVPSLPGQKRVEKARKDRGRQSHNTMIKGKRRTSWFILIQEIPRTYTYAAYAYTCVYFWDIYIYIQICVYRYPDFPSTCKVLRIRSNTEWVLGIFGQPSGWMFFGSHVTYSSKDESAPWPILYTTKYELVMYRSV